jgi:hypothetical protein
MAESTTAVYKLVKPDIGGSKETWGNRLNKDLDDLDTHLALHNSSQWTGLQNGLNTNVVKDYTTTPPGTLPLSDERFRTAGNVLTYTNAMIDTIGGNANATPPVVASTEFFDPKKRGILTPQALVYRMLDLLMPVGTIVLWSGTADTIPGGWHLCDNVGDIQIEGGGGAEMTVPDLRGRFVIGAYPDGSAKPKMMPLDPISGTASVFGHNHANVVLGHTLTPDEIPPHAHGSTGVGSDSFVARMTSNATYYITGPGSGQTAQFGQATVDTKLNGSSLSPGGIDGNPAEHTHPISNVQNTTPDSPWYALCYIIKIRKWETFY